MLANVVDRSFVLLETSWPAGKARRILERLQPSHAIVREADSEYEYYLFTVPEMLALLPSSGDAEPTRSALDLEHRLAAPVLDAHDDELEAPDRAVVLDGGRVIGFVDAAAAPLPSFTRSRGFESAFAARPEPVARSLVADFPAQVAVGDTASLLVLLSADPTAGPLLVAVPVGTTIDVIVQAKRGFALVGPREGQIVVADAEETEPLQFKLQATEVGLGVVRLYSFAAGRSLGSVTIEAQVVPSSSERLIVETTSSTKPLPAIEGVVPDLSLIITDQWVAGKRGLLFTLRTREPLDSRQTKQRFGPVPLEVDPQQHFRDFFKDIEDLSLETDWADRLADKGRDLYRRLVPEDLRALLWALRERIHSVEIQSEEPWIPWELCKLQGRENGRVVEGPFICEAFAMTRWLPELASKCVLPLRKIALVVPAGSGLANAEAEREFVLTLADGGRQVEVVPARLEDVLGALKRGSYDGWHFVCHGTAHDTNPDRAKLELEGGDVIRPENLGGEVENLGVPAPLVFLNACQSGHGARSLTGIGGWAERFLRAASGEDYPEHGAAAFVGTYWRIDDQIALPFAKEFYTALLADGGTKTIGEAVRDARLAIRSLGGPTWLAYTAFAHPLATVG